MDEGAIGVGLGALTGALGLLAQRFPLLAWLSLTPVGYALFGLAPVPAALAGSLAGAVLVSASLGTPTLLPVMILGGVGAAVSWGALAAALAALWPDGEVWPALALVPLFGVGALCPLRWMGAPRWLTNPLARTQEGWLGIVHIARLGSDLWVTFAAALGSTVCLALGVAVQSSPSQGAVVEEAILVGALALLIASALLGYGVFSYLGAVRRVESSRRVRVAAVVCDGSPPGDPDNGFWPLESSEYADVRATQARYATHIERAARAGATILVLPEVAVRVDRRTRAEWIDGVSQWSIQYRVAIVAPFYDDARPSNELVVIGPGGNVAAMYEKQHPAPIEAKRHERMPPARAVVASLADLVVSSVICVDLDYGDLVGPVENAGGILAVPANDWRKFERLHHRTAVWAAVMSGVSLVRSTGHGISSAYDAAGRVIAEKSSADGPVVLVVDLPVAESAG
jgi:predicted amidohydrolase